MKDVAPWIMGPALLLLSAGLLWWQSRGEPGPDEGTDEETASFFRRQGWRRFQVAVLLGVVGIAIMAGPWITTPLAAGIFWIGVILMVIWIAILGLIDMWASREWLDDEAKRIEQERNELIANLDQQTRSMRSKRTAGENSDGK